LKLDPVTQEDINAQLFFLIGYLYITKLSFLAKT